MNLKTTLFNDNSNNKYNLFYTSKNINILIVIIKSLQS